MLVQKWLQLLRGLEANWNISLLKLIKENCIFECEGSISYLVIKHPRYQQILAQPKMQIENTVVSVAISLPNW